MGSTQGLLPYKIEFVDRAETVTAHAGLPLVIEAAMALLPAEALHPLRKALGYATLTPVRRHVFSLIALIAAQAKDFLYRFHQAEDGQVLTDDDDARLSVRGRAQIRPEGPGLQALDSLHQQALKAYEGTRGYQPQMAWWAELGVR